MKSIPFVFLIVFCVAIWEFGSTNPVAMSCDSCGSECARACGTRHFRSCCFNYVRKRSMPFHPYSLNKLRYEALYRQFPYGNNNQENLQNNKNEQEQKPRKLDPRIGDSGASRNEIVDANLKSFYKPWKDESPMDVSISVDDYDEHRRSSEPKQQPSNYDA